ncbi:MAG: hypothetical protein KTR20_06000 [Cellvibrionaceae bacterium]|nr:hypothetical protein [Cellvibrionaceae bacterium]
MSSQGWAIKALDSRYTAPLSKTAICGDNLELLAAYEHLHFQWIGIDDFMHLLAQWFSDCIFYNNTPLVIALLQEGLQAYGQLLTAHDRAYYPHQRLKHFLTASLLSAKKNACFVVIDQQRKDQWCLLNDTAFPLWGFNRAALAIEPFNLNARDLTQRLYQKTVPKNLKLAMRRFNHEHAIMAGDMACCH